MVFAILNRGGQSDMNKSAARAVEILEYLASAERGGRPAGISEISRDLDIPKSSVFDCVYTLLEKGFLQCVGENQKNFSLGLKAAQLGFSAMRQFDIARIAAEELTALREKTGQTVLLCAERGGSLIVISKTRESGPVRFAVTVGSELPFHMTAAGKAILAAMPDEDWKRLIGTGCYSTHTANSISNAFLLERELKKIRRDGYAVENYEENNSTFAVAAPIYDYNDNVTAAVSVSLFRVDAEQTDISALAQAVTESALRISAQMRSEKRTTY